ncbi:hypothetical protein MMC25_006415 [Agyrium rufum]|nr:hypothetical protein [Agyrium rufum]
MPFFLTFLLFWLMILGNVAQGLIPFGEEHHNFRDIRHQTVLTRSLDLDRWLLAPQTSLNLLWSSPGRPSRPGLSEMTISTSYDNESIVSIEALDTEIEEMSCSASGIDITFRNHPTFEAIEHTWKGVNLVDNHTYVAMIGARDYKTNGNRFPFLVDHIEFAPNRSSVRLVGMFKGWDATIHTFRLQKRDSHRVDHRFEVAFPKITSGVSFKLAKGFTLDLTCSGCATKGYFDVVGQINLSPFAKKRYAIFDVTAVSVSGRFGLQLATTNSLKSASWVGKSHKLFGVAFEGFGVNLPSWLEAGANFDVHFGMNFQGVTGAMGMNVPVSFRIADGSTVSFDLIDPEWRKPRGEEPNHWDLDVDIGEPGFYGQIRASLKVYLELAFVLSAGLIGEGFDAGLKIQLPYITARATTIVDTKNEACGEKGLLSLVVEIIWGASTAINWARLQDQGKPFANWTFSTYAAPLWAAKCLPLLQPKNWSTDVDAKMPDSIPTLPPPTTPVTKRISSKRPTISGP